MVESFKMIQYLKKRLCVSNKAQFSGTVSESCALHSILVIRYFVSSCIIVFCTLFFLVFYRVLISSVRVFGINIFITNHHVICFGDSYVIVFYSN